MKTDVEDLTAEEIEYIAEVTPAIARIYRDCRDTARALIGVVMEWWDELDDETKWAIVEEASPDETGGMTLDELLGDIDDVLEEADDG